MSRTDASPAQTCAAMRAWSLAVRYQDRPRRSVAMPGNTAGVARQRKCMEGTTASRSSSKSNRYGRVAAAADRET